MNIHGRIFTEPEANNCFIIITKVIIREKQEPPEKCQFYLFVSFKLSLVNEQRRPVSDHMLNR